jgi:hypothetical protein
MTSTECTDMVLHISLLCRFTGKSYVALMYPYAHWVYCHSHTFSFSCCQSLILRSIFIPTTRGNLIFFCGTTAPVGLGLPPWNSPFHFGFILNLRQSVGLFGRVISSSQGLYLYTNTEKRTHTNIKHPCPEWDSNPWSRLPSERRQCMP